MPGELEKRNGTSTEKINKRHLTQMGKYKKCAKEKEHNMDKMLAQLVLLDTALEEKKKDKNRRAFKQSKGMQRKEAKNDDKKKKTKNNREASSSNKIDFLRTNTDQACQCHLPTAYQKVNIGPSHIASNLHASDLASGTTKRSLSTENAHKQCKNDDENSKRYSVEVDTNDIFCLVEKPEKNCSQHCSSLSESDELCEPTRSKKHKSRSSKKSKKNRKDHDSNYEEDVLRRKLSSISIDSIDGETQTNLMKKENDYINTPANDIVSTSKNETSARKNSTCKSEGTNGKNSVSEDIQAAQANEIESNESKCDPNRAYTAQSRNLMKMPIDNGSELGHSMTPARTNEIKPPKEAVDQLHIADTVLPAKYSKKMDKKAVKNQEIEACDEIPSRVIVVKNPRIKSRKKHKSKTTESTKRSETQQSSRKDQVKTVSKAEEQQRPREKPKKSSRERREKSINAKQEIRKVDGYEGHLHSTSQKQDTNQHRKLQKDKKKKKTVSSEEERLIAVGKTRYQTNHTNYETKSAKTQPTTPNYNDDQKAELEKQKISQDSTTKYVSKRLSDTDLWHSIKPHVSATPTDQHRQARVTRAAKKEDKSRTNDEEIKKDKSSKNKKRHRDVEKRSIPNQEKTSKGGRNADSSNWHTNVYAVSNTFRPELRGWKHNNSDKSIYGLSPPNYLTRAVSSSESNSNSFSAESLSTRDSALSSYSHSSSNQSLKEERHNGRQRHLDKYNNSKSNSSSYEINNKNDITPSSTAAAFTRSRPRQQRSASSTSSFQRYPIKIVDAKSRPQYKHNNETSAKRYESKAKNAGNKTEDAFNESPPSSPNDDTFEPKFGKRRTKRQNVCVVAEGEDGHSPWQHQQLVVVSQKPGTLLNRKSGLQKPVQTKQPGNFAKNISGGSDKRPQTIRDLYSLHNVLSDTQNGTVISGYRRNDGMRVAIKRISKAATSRWGKMNTKTVPLELALLCQVNESRCSGVVQVVEWHETNEAYLLVMIRPHPVVDLYDYVTKHKRIKEVLARHIIRQLVTALRDCINCGVLHRDIKLENILLNPETMEITLIDFGCGDYVRTTPYKEFAGTPEYYAPEWFSRKQYNAEPMTAWSIGVLLYSLLCGTLPFRSSVEIREKDTSKFPSDVSRVARDLVASLLQKHPRERLAMCDILDHPWLSKSAKISS